MDKTRHLLAALLLAASTGFAGPSEDAARYYEDAIVQFDREDYKAAAIQLKNALQADPNNLPARVLLGRVHLAEGNGAAAQKELETANKLGADRSLTMLPLAEALNQQRKYKEVLARIIPQGFSPQLEGELRFQRGNAMLELGELVEARNAFERALDLQPDSVLPKVGLAMLALRQAKFEAAEQLANEALKIAPKNLQAWHTKGAIAYAQGDLEKAILNYNRALAIEPKHFLSRLSLASAMMDAGRFSEAAEILKELRDQNKWDPQVSFLLAVALEKTGDAAGSRAAIRHASGLVNNVPIEVLREHLPTLLLAGLVSYSNREFENAYNALNMYVERDPDHVIARKLLGSTLLAMNEPLKAIPVLKTAINIAPNAADLHQLLGDAYLKARQYANAVDSYNEAERLAPGKPEILARLGMSQLATEDRAAAIDNLEAALRKRPDAKRTALTLAGVHLAAGNTKRAEQLARDLVDSDPKDVNAINLLAAAQLARGDLSHARANFDKALQIQPDYRPARINLAKLDAREGNAEQARRAMQRLLDAAPEDTSLIHEAAKIEVALGDIDHAIALLQKANGINRRAIGPALYLVKLYQRQGNTQAALAVVRDLQAAHPDNLQVLEAMARMQVAAGEKDKARGLLQRMTGMAGYNAPRLYRIGELQLLAGAPDDARWSFQKALDAEPDKLLYLTGLAELQIDTGRLEQADKLIGQIRRQHPKSIVGHLLTGKLAMRERQFKRAINAYEGALALQPDERIALQLFRARMADQQPDKALAELTDWVKKHPDHIAATRALAELLHSQDKPKQALPYYEAALKAQPKNPQILNNLANLYAEIGDGRAMALAKKAYQIAPEHPAVLDTLGWQLSQSGDPQKGLSLLRNAIARQADSPEIRYHLAATLSKLGRASEAKRELQKALADKRPFKGRDAAERELKALAAN